MATRRSSSQPRIGGATRGVLSVEMTRKDWGGARALGLPITVHTSGPSPIKLLAEAGLLGPDVQNPDKPQDNIG